MQCSREYVGIISSLALNLIFFLLRSPGDRVRSILIVSCISRFLLAVKLRNCIHIYIHFNRLTDRLLIMVLMNNREGSGDVGLIIS